MADPKGVYYGPSEKGWATVLPAGPNLAGLAAMKQKQAAAKKADDSLKKQQARDKAIKDAYDALSGPAHTDAFYQDGLNAKVNASIRQLTEMVSDENFDPARVRAFAATSAQDILSWKSAGEQVWEDINAMNAWNKENGLIINEGRLNEYITGNVLVDADGKKRDPVSIYQQEGFGNPERFLYENPGGKSAGAALLDASSVIGNLLKQDYLKAAVVESAVQKASASAELITTSGKGSQTSVRPFAEIDVATGSVKIKDPDQLVESGLLSAMLDYRPFALMVDALVEEDVRKMPKEDASVISDDRMTEMMAEKAIELLKGYAAGGTKVKNESYTKLAGRGRAGGGGKDDDQTVDVWVQAIISGDPRQLSSALDYINTLFSSTNENLLNDNLDALTAGGFFPNNISQQQKNTIASIRVSPDKSNPENLNIIYYNIKDRVIGTKLVTRKEFGSSESIKNRYSVFRKRVGRTYSSSETGQEPVPTEVQQAVLDTRDLSGVRVETGQQFLSVDRPGVSPLPSQTPKKATKGVADNL